MDVLEIIESDEEQGVPAPAQVFVSYQWDNQAEVLLIRSQVITRLILKLLIDENNRVILIIYASVVARNMVMGVKFGNFALKKLC